MNELILQYPIQPVKVNQGWGTNGEWYRKNDINIKGHNGVDFWGPDGWEVMAAHDGEVLFVGHDSKEGLGVTIRTTEKFKYNETEAHFKTIYWHLKEGSVKVKPGQLVKAGDVIAEADNTGFSTGSHLHFALKPIKIKSDGKTIYNLEQDNGYFGAIDPTGYFITTLPEPGDNIDKTFKNGDRIRVASGPLNVREFIGLSSKLLGLQEQDAEGTVLYGGVSVDGHIWWEIEYDEEPSGWCSMEFLELVEEEEDKDPEEIPEEEPEAEEEKDLITRIIEKIRSFLKKFAIWK